jgi:hypothetical protein
VAFVLLATGCPVSYQSVIHWQPRASEEFPVAWEMSGPGRGVAATAPRPAVAPPAAPSPPSAAARPRAIVAVFDIQDQGGRIQPEALVQLTEYLATRLAETGAFRVVPHEQLRSRLVQEKVESYKECYEQSCQIEIGKAIAAEKSLSTKILRVGTQCAITATLYDLKSETAEAGASSRTDCTDNALMDGIDQVATQVAGR